MDVYSLRLSPQHVERIRGVARLRGMTPSRLLRLWVEERLAQEPPDGEVIARSLATDLGEIFGDRLVRVILFGSWARGEAHAESDVDLLVVLRDMRSRHEERLRMYRTVGDHALAAGRSISALPVSEEQLHDPQQEAVRAALREGKDVLERA